MSNIPALPDPQGSIEPFANGGQFNGRAPAYAPPAEAGALDIARLIQAVFRYKWFVVAALVLGAGAGLAASTFVKPHYEARGRIWIAESGGQDAGNQGPIREAPLLETYGWVQLLKSYAVLDSVVDKLKLFVTTAPADEPLFATFGLRDRFRVGSYRLTVNWNGTGYQLTTGDGQILENGPANSPVGATRGFLWTPPPATWTPNRVVEFSVRSPRDIAIFLESAIHPQVAENAPVMQLTLEGGDARRVAETLNAVMDRFVQVAASFKREKLDTLTAILAEQLRVAETKKEAAERALEAYRVQIITLPSGNGTAVAPGVQETRDPVMSRFFDMKMRLEELRQDNALLENITRKVMAGELTWNALSAVPSAQTSPALSSLLQETARLKGEVATLMLRYTKENPKVTPLLAAISETESVKIPEAVRRLQGELRTQQRALEGNVESASTVLKQIPPRKIEETRLVGQVDITATLYATLRSRYEEARLAAVSSVPDVRVLDRANIPFSPLSNQKPMVVAGFTAGAVGLALLGIVLRDKSDRRVRYPEQVTTGMGLVILGAVPRARGGLKSQDSRALIQLSEAFRELRLAVVHAYGSAGPIVLSVTSPESGDGKSTVCGSLATVFADQGHSVLLIDGDIRRGDLHRSLGVRRAPGLTDFLSGRARLEDVLQVTDRGFTLIGSGTRMQAGPELLGSTAMTQLVRSLRSRYGVIIVDTPPLGAGVDAYILGTITGNMVLVLRTGRTDGELAEAKLTQIDRLPIRILGAILNDVPPSRLYRQYTYLPGYQAEDEIEAALQISAANGIRSAD
jgi:capsular exopolysaccharide synthesis family protein